MSGVSTRNEAVQAGAERVARRTLLGVLVAWSAFAWAYVLPVGVAGDFEHYLDGVRLWLATGSPYEADPQLSRGTFIHPPIALLLFAPFLVAPAVLWWAFPLGILGWCLWRWRPSGWAVVAVVAMLGLPRSVELVKDGNTDMWVAAFVALGLAYRWPAALVLVKPSSVVYALAGARDRRWWATVAALAVVSLAFGTLWLEWVRVVRDVAGGAGYLLGGWVFAAVPLVAWAGRTQVQTERVAAA